MLLVDYFTSVYTSVFCETRIHSFPLVYSLVSGLYLGFMKQEYSPGISGNVLSRDAWVTMMGPLSGIIGRGR
jgi:hypothetical protein